MAEEIAEIYTRIPKKQLGKLISEHELKQGLQDLQPDLFFDVALKLNIPHPEIEYCQGVYYDGFPEGKKHVAAMDRGRMMGGLIPEVPIWSTHPDIVEVGWNDISAAELARQEFPFPMPCFHDMGKVQVKRQVRGDLIMLGWRDTLLRLIRHHIPGITYRSTARKFIFEWRDLVESMQVEGDQTPPWEDDDFPKDEELLNEWGEYVAPPSIIVPDMAKVEK